MQCRGHYKARRVSLRVASRRDLIVIQAEATIGNTTDGSGDAGDVYRE